MAARTLSPTDEIALEIGRLVLEGAVAAMKKARQGQNYGLELAIDNASFGTLFHSSPESKCAEQILRCYLGESPVSQRWPPLWTERAARRRRTASAEPEETITLEDTLRAAGIDDARQAAYQRKMSTLLGGETR